MSGSRGLLPLALAITFGILNGVATFGPAFKDQEREKLEKKQKEPEAAGSAGLPEEPKVIGDGGAMNGAEAPGRQQRDSAAPEKLSWWSVFRWHDGTISASKAEDGGATDPRTEGDPQARNSASTGSS